MIDIATVCALSTVQDEKNQLKQKTVNAGRGF